MKSRRGRVGVGVIGGGGGRSVGVGVIGGGGGRSVGVGVNGGGGGRLVDNWWSIGRGFSMEEVDEEVIEKVVLRRREVIETFWKGGFGEVDEEVYEEVDEEVDEEVEVIKKVEVHDTGSAWVRLFAGKPHFPPSSVYFTDPARFMLKHFISHNSTAIDSIKEYCRIQQYSVEFCLYTKGIPSIPNPGEEVTLYYHHDYDSIVTSDDSSDWSDVER